MKIKTQHKELQDHDKPRYQNSNNRKNRKQYHH